MHKLGTQLMIMFTEIRMPCKDDISELVELKQANITKADTTCADVGFICPYADFIRHFFYIVHFIYFPVFLD